MINNNNSYDNNDIIIIVMNLVYFLKLGAEETQDSDKLSYNFLV